MNLRPQPSPASSSPPCCWPLPLPRRPGPPRARVPRPHARRHRRRGGAPGRGRLQRERDAHPGLSGPGPGARSLPRAGRAGPAPLRAVPARQAHHLSSAPPTAQRSPAGRARRARSRSRATWSYRYAQRALAKRGYVTVSVMANGVDGQEDVSSSDFGAAARSALVRRHLRLWDAWTTGLQPGPGGHGLGGSGGPRPHRPGRAQPRWRGSRAGGCRHPAELAVAGAQPGAAGPGGQQQAVRPAGADHRAHGLLRRGPQLLARPGLRRRRPGRRPRACPAQRGLGHRRQPRVLQHEWMPGLASTPAGDDGSHFDGEDHELCGRDAPSRLSAAEQRAITTTYLVAATEVFVDCDTTRMALFDGRLVPRSDLPERASRRRRSGGTACCSTPLRRDDQQLGGSERATVPRLRRRRRPVLLLLRGDVGAHAPLAAVVQLAGDADRARGRAPLEPGRGPRRAAGAQPLRPRSLPVPRRTDRGRPEGGAGAARVPAHRRRRRQGGPGAPARGSAGADAGKRSAAPPAVGPAAPRPSQGACRGRGRPRVHHLGRAGQPQRQRPRLAAGRVRLATRCPRAGRHLRAAGRRAGRRAAGGGRGSPRARGAAPGHRCVEEPAVVGVQVIDEATSQALPPVRVRIEAGRHAGVVEIPYTGDTTRDPDRGFTVNLWARSGAVVGR